jgi:hypothetical protein
MRQKLNFFLSKLQPYLSWLHKLRRFDVYPKAENEIIARTSYGGVATAVAVVIIAILILSELYDFTSVRTTGSLYVDNSRQKTMQIEFLITFPHLQCSETNVDVVDEVGDQQITLTKSVSKVDLNSVGLELGRRECMPCHGTFSWRSFVGLGFNSMSPLCCSCQQVIDYYSKIYPGQNDLLKRSVDSHPLCLRERDPRNVGCRVSGMAEVNKVRGNLHIALGKSGEQRHGSHGHHVHQLDQSPNELKKYDLQHTIHLFRCGREFPGRINPLEGFVMSQPGLTRTTYFVTVVPTIYDDGNILETYQYSVTNHTEIVVPEGNHWHLPGVFIKYDFSPIMAKITRKRYYVSHFIMRSFALIGGVWVVVGILYSCTHNLYKNLLKKRE